MRAGALRHVVEVQRPNEVKDAMSQRVIKFATESRRRAAILPLKQEERVEADQVKGVRTHRIVLRHYPDLTSRWRIKYGSRTFEVDGIVNVNERNVETQALCVEVS
jgi:SPP1 family predicted phage head-tail adaptor